MNPMNSKLKRVLELWHEAHVINYVLCDCIGDIDLSQEYFRILNKINFDRESWVAIHKSAIYGVWKAEVDSYEAAYSAMINHLREQVDEAISVFIQNIKHCEEVDFDSFAAKVAAMRQIKEHLKAI